MILFREFNRSKNNSVLLIHGLFSNSGFWLEHLHHFKDFKIVLCDIDYGEFFNNPKAFYNKISDYICEHHIKNTLAHSFGSSINLSITKHAMKINICPTNFKSRINKINFVNEVHFKTKIDKAQIKKLLSEADIFLKKNQSIYRDNISDNINFIPTNDRFFTYNEKPNFEGDHFNIGHALKKIMQLNELIK